MGDEHGYDIHLDDKYGSLRLIDIPGEIAANEPWFNQTRPGWCRPATELRPPARGGRSVRAAWHTTNMRSHTSRGQLILFPGADRPPRPDRPRRRSRSARKAQALDELAALAEREAAEARRAGDAVSARAARDRAAGARRAAELLRAGPGGVADVLGGRTEAA